MDIKLEGRIKKIEERLESIEKLLQEPSSSVNKSSKKLSVKEFLLQKNPKSEIEITFLLGYYLEKMEMKESFGVEDLRKAFRSAKISLPKNINDTVNKNIAKGYFMDTENKQKGQKAWMVTATGEKHAEGEK